MTTLAITDLNMDKELDNLALTSITGQGHYHFVSSSIKTGSWSSYRLTASNFKGYVNHYGRKVRLYNESWKRSRRQTEYSKWNYFV